MDMTSLHTKVDPIADRREVRIRVRALLSEVRYEVAIISNNAKKYMK